MPFFGLLTRDASLTSTCLRNLTALCATLLGLDSQAADLNARDFFAAPPGTSLGVLYLPATRAGDFHGPADSTGKADLRVNAVAYRQVYFTDACGTLCTPQFILPFADINARLPGANQRSRERGLGDPQVGGTLFFVNDPASRTYSGLLSLITVPVGEYHSQNPDVSPGANRWGATFVYNYTHGIGENGYWKPTWKPSSMAAMTITLAANSSKRRCIACRPSPRMTSAPPLTALCA